MRRSREAALAHENAFADNVDHTLEAAFGLAVRVLGDREAASRACEAAHFEAWESGKGANPWGAAEEIAFLGRVRQAALRARAERNPRPGPVAGAYEPASAFAETAELGRRAVELCFGGLTAGDAADVLDAPVDEVRKAMRVALLAMGAAAGSAFCAE